MVGYQRGPALVVKLVIGTHDQIGVVDRVIRNTMPRRVVIKGHLSLDGLIARTLHFELHRLAVAALRDHPHVLDLVGMRLLHVAHSIEDLGLRGGYDRGEIRRPVVSGVSDIFAQQAGLGGASRLIQLPTAVAQYNDDYQRGDDLVGLAHRGSRSRGSDQRSKVPTSSALAFT